MRILQIIPADGWFAQHTINGKTELSPIACWALKCDDGGVYQYVVGMIKVVGLSSLMQISETIGGFEGYVFKEETR